jgi:hypothetical protein
VPGSSTGLQHFLNEPGANAMSHKEHSCLGAIRGEQLIEEFDVRLYLRGQGHRSGVGKRAFAADERGQAQVRVSEDGCGSVDLVIDCI